MKKVMLVFGTAGERIPETARTGGNCSMCDRTTPGNAGPGIGYIRYLSRL